MARSSITLTADLNETGPNTLVYTILATEIKQNTGDITVDHVTGTVQASSKESTLKFSLLTPKGTLNYVAKGVGNLFTTTGFSAEGDSSLNRGAGSIGVKIQRAGKRSGGHGNPASYGGAKMLINFNFEEPSS